MFLMRAFAFLALLAFPVSLPAQSASLFTQGVDGAQRTPFVASLGTADPLQARAASLFGGGQRHSFLAPCPTAPIRTPARHHPAASLAADPSHSCATLSLRPRQDRPTMMR